MTSPAIQHKIQLYSAATYLFDQGLSHPQIVEELRPYERDEQLLIEIVDKAMRSEWDELEKRAKQMISEGKEFQEVISILTKDERDRELVLHICNYWDQLKLEQFSMANEAPSCIREGIWGLPVSLAIFIGTILLDLSIFGKIIAGLGVVASIGMVIIGVLQRRMSRKIERIMRTPIS